MNCTSVLITRFVFVCVAGVLGTGFVGVAPAQDAARILLLEEKLAFVPPGRVPAVSYTVREIGRIAGAMRLAVPETGNHLLVLSSEGKVWTWGSNRAGQLGVGDTAARARWVEVTDLDQVVAIAAGAEHSIALRADGTVWTWGANSAGQLGDGSRWGRSRPVEVAGLHDAMALAAGHEFTMALRRDGTVWIWGSHWQGATAVRAMPVRGLEKVQAIWVQGNRPYAQDEDGRQWTWGTPEGPEPVKEALVPETGLSVRWPGILQRDRLVRVVGAALEVQEKGDTAERIVREDTVIDLAAGWAVGWIEMESSRLIAAPRQAATPSTVALGSSPNPSVYGAPATLTATVSPAAATGKVTFYDGTSVQGVGTLGGGKATLRTSLLPAGNRPLQAYYGGDATYAASTSAVSIQTVSAQPANDFRTAVSYPAGAGPWSVAMADFNADGKADLAVAVEGGVRVLLGNGNGTFQAAATYSAGVGPIAVAAGDFNGDAKTDLAVANHNGANVSVLLGAGNGTFQAAVNYPVGSGPGVIEVADFNRDGLADLAVGCEDLNVRVLLGNGDGTFQATAYYPAGAGPWSVAAADFNGDGKADLAVANFSGNNVSVLLGNGNGTFQGAANYPVGSEPWSVAAGDFNGDGKADLAVANHNGNTVSVLLGNGNGTFRTAVSYSAGTGPTFVAIGDFNGDGDADLAVASEGSDSVTVMRGNGNGTFQGAINYPVGALPRSVAIGDFDGDGRADLVAANYGSANVSVLLGRLAAALNVRGGDGQSGTVGQPLAKRLVVGLSYSSGVPVPGVIVTFSVTAGAATLDPSRTTTGLDGTASTQATLGSTPGTVTVTASVAGLSPVVFTITATAAAPVVQISSGGVVGAGLSIPPVKAVSANGIAAVFGENFAPAGTYRQVTAADLVNGQIPTKLLGVCVLVGNTPAPIFFVVPSQINFQVPQVGATGTVEVRVATGCGTAGEVRSAPEVVSVQATTPEFFYFQLNADGVNPVAGYNAVTYVLVGQPGMLPSATFAPARPGDYVTLFLTGLGATTPGLAPGVLADTIARIDGTVQVTLGGVSLVAAEISYAGVTPGSAGLYQLNLRVPEAVQSGKQPIVVSVNGVASPVGAYLDVRR